MNDLPDGDLPPLITIEQIWEQVKEECIKVVREQSLYPDTHTGKRQQWMKDQIIEKIKALSPTDGPIS